MQVPEGWVIEDYENVLEPDPNLETIAMLCPENEALPGIGGESNCLAANRTDSILILRYPDLQSMPEFQDIPEPTTNDLLALYIQNSQSRNTTSDMQIVNTTDIDEFTKIVNMTYTVHDDAGTFLPFDDFTYNNKGLFMFALSQDRNAGYILLNVRPLEHEIQAFTQHKPGAQQVFNTFEVVPSS